MLEQLKYIHNVGRFKTFQGTPDTDLRRLTLVFAENGRGKTTLCSILRSLTSGDAAHIVERRRVSATSDPRVVVAFDGNQASFDGAKWRTDGPEIMVFDDHFTDANVYSGLAVDSAHRKGVHELVVGEDGVRLQHEVEELTRSISELQSDLRKKEKAIPATALGNLSVDEFCELPTIENLPDELEEARKSVSVLRDAKKVQDTGGFVAIALPVLPEVEPTLQVVLDDLDSAALNEVAAHLSDLGEGGEAWVAKGARKIDGRTNCPFCQQSLSGSALVGHYRKYFSEAYATHKARIDDLRVHLEETHGGDRLARFSRSLQQAKERRDFWSGYIDVPPLDVDAEEAARLWVSVRDELAKAIEAKASAPLETATLHPQALKAIEEYEAFNARVRKQSLALLEKNDDVAQAKEHAEHGNLPAAEAHLAKVEATARRAEAEVAASCADYLLVKIGKLKAEADKEAAREALDKHRRKVFGTYQAAINKYLVKFNADFTLEELSPTDPRGQPSATYTIGVSKKQVPLSSKKTEPTFRTVLSAGDRNTLALAFFFATLHCRSSLADVVVVIDDPTSSLDEGRRHVTVQEIRGLLGRVNQVLVLSHSKPLLTHLWEGADKDSTVSLEIRTAPDGEGSTIVPWNAAVAAISEFDRNYALVSEYAKTQAGDCQKVAPALRMVLEGFLRVAFIDHFPPGKMLGQFLSAAKQAMNDGRPFVGDELIQELDALREYANRFHHTTSDTWQENLSNINEVALRGYSKRVIEFTQRGRGVESSG